MAYSTSLTPKAWGLLILNNSTQSVTFPSVAHYCSIFNHSTEIVQVKLNNDVDCIFTLDIGQFYEFRAGDIHVTSVFLTNPASGGGSAIVEVIASFAS